MNKPNVRSLSSAFMSMLIATSPLASVAQQTSGGGAASNSSKAAVDKSQLTVGKRYFISADALNVRSSNSTTASNIVGKLSGGDEVELVNALNAATPLVQIKIVNSSSVKANVAPELFVSKDYISEKSTVTSSGKYFVIQNVATEKTRVYERCTETPGCAHKMVMETDMVVGRPEEGTKKDPHAFKTWLGHSKIGQWVKFYQDGAGHYPYWYKAGQNINTIPKPLNGDSIFAASDWMVKGHDGNKTIYGAFGWYAARLVPESENGGVNYQWIHGTIGWGVDGDYSIKFTRGALANLFSNPGSAGCTRLENRAVAYLRHLLPVGTDIYRVYARESTRENENVRRRPLSGKVDIISPLARYSDKVKPAKWDFILLTDGAQKKDGLTADARTIIDKAIPVIAGQNLLEKGTYDVDQYPTAVPLNYNNTASSGLSGDRYEIDSGRPNSGTNFVGYFLVDEGRFVGYKHPDTKATKGKIKVSGLADFTSSVPEFLSTTGSHNPPPVEYKTSNNSGDGGGSYYNP